MLVARGAAARVAACRIGRRRSSSTRCSRGACSGSSSRSSPALARAAAPAADPAAGLRARAQRPLSVAVLRWPARARSRARRGAARRPDTGGARDAAGSVSSGAPCGGARGRAAGRPARPGRHGLPRSASARAACRARNVATCSGGGLRGRTRAAAAGSAGARARRPAPAPRLRRRRPALRRDRLGRRLPPPILRSTSCSSGRPCRRRHAPTSWPLTAQFRRTHSSAPASSRSSSVPFWRSTPGTWASRTWSRSRSPGSSAHWPRRRRGRRLRRRRRCRRSAVSRRGLPARRRWRAVQGPGPQARAACPRNRSLRPRGPPRSVRDRRR
jgi:hypothetical protein